MLCRGLEGAYQALPGEGNLVLLSEFPWHRFHWDAFVRDCQTCRPAEGAEVSTLSSDQLVDLNWLHGVTHDTRTPQLTLTRAAFHASATVSIINCNPEAGGTS